MSRTDRWIIVGGGASGLAAAFFLKQAGLDSVIVERDSVVGGRMGTVRLGDRWLDCGGKNIGRQYTLFRQFARSLGHHPLEYFGLNSSQVVNGRVKTFEANARWRTMLDVARGIPARDLIRFGRLLWHSKSNEANGYLGSTYSRTLGGRCDHVPASRYFSLEFCQRILRPMTVRMNGAEPDEVYMGNLTSNVRMLLDTYEQFAHGLHPLLNAFVERYDVRLNTASEGLITNGDRVTGVRVRHANGKTSDLEGAGVILATPATVTAALTEPVLPQLTRELRSIAYYPVALVIAEYDTPVFSPGVRALVFDGNHAVSNAGAYGVADLHLVRYTFSGRTARRWIAESTDAEALLAMGEAALSKHIRIDRQARRRFVAKSFNPGLCAYTPHHAGLIDRVQQELKKVHGLHVTGDYVQGASIEACFRSASACARQIVRRAESIH